MCRIPSRLSKAWDDELIRVFKPSHMVQQLAVLHHGLSHVATGERAAGFNLTDRATGAIFNPMRTRIARIPPRPADTTPEAEQVQTALFRAATTTRRLRSAFGLSAAVITAARRGLERAYPDEGGRNRALRFVALHYGVELAAALRTDLERRDRERPTAG